jgi:hypothetical protein
MPTQSPRRFLFEPDWSNWTIVAVVLVLVVALAAYLYFMGSVS